MARIALIDRADMNADQARVYDAAKASNSPVGGPYYAYIRLPKLFEAAQNQRGCLSSGPLSGFLTILPWSTAPSAMKPSSPPPSGHGWPPRPPSLTASKTPTYRLREEEPCNSP